MNAHRDALISPCGAYRYWLCRLWNTSLPIGLVCMINPSTADAKVDDATIRSLMRRGQFWGWGGFYVVNLFALRSSDPKALRHATDPIGPDNDTHIARLATTHVSTLQRPCVVAWGAASTIPRPTLDARAKPVLALLRTHGDVYCLARTADGSPTHPSARGTHRIPDNAPLALYQAKT